MLRSILAIVVGSVIGAVGIVAGFVLGGIVVFLIELPGMYFHPLPPGVTMSDTEALKAHFTKAPLAALMGVAIAWTIGPLVATLVATSICWFACFVYGLIVENPNWTRARKVFAFCVPPAIVGALFLAADVFNLMSFPHPAWLAAVGIIAPPISAYLGGSLVSRIVRQLAGGPKTYDMREKNMAC